MTPKPQSKRKNQTVLDLMTQVTPTSKLVIEILKAVTFWFSWALGHRFGKNQEKLHTTILFEKEKPPHDLHKLQGKFSIFLSAGRNLVEFCTLNAHHLKHGAIFEEEPPNEQNANPRMSPANMTN
jgi:hypothetical protein